MTMLAPEVRAVRLLGRADTWTLVDGPQPAPTTRWTTIDRHAGTRREDAAARLAHLRARAAALGTTWDPDDSEQLAADRADIEALRAAQLRAIEATE